MVKTATKPFDRFKKVLIFVSMGAFGFSMIGETVQMFQKSDGGKTPVTQEQSAEQQLQQRVNGYKTILAREPNNKTALEGLLVSQIQLKQLPEAISTLEQLVKVSPDVPEYKEQLAALKEEQARQAQSAANQTNGGEGQTPAPNNNAAEPPTDNSPPAP